MSNSNVSVSFNIAGTVTQDITIVDDFVTPKEFVEKLESGQYLTTIDVDSADPKNNGQYVVKFDETGNEVVVGVISSQMGLEGMKFFDFQLDTDEEESEEG